MDLIALLLGSAALLALTLAGFAWIVGLRAVRDRLLRFTAWAVVLGLIVPPIIKTVFMYIVASTKNVPTNGITSQPEVVIPFVLGHLVLAVFLLRRRLRDHEHARREGADLDRARTRERPRLTARPEDPET